MVELVEVLVGFKDSTRQNRPTDRIFQTAISATIVDAYVNSVFGVLSVAGRMPCILMIYNSVLVVPLSMCSDIFRIADLQIYTREIYEGDDKIKTAKLPSESCGANDGS